jgi:tripartite ATP-independent transporter DctM subunit
MEWYWILLIIFGSLCLIMATGIPVAFSFLAVNIVGAFILYGGLSGLPSLAYSMWFSLASFVYLPIPMFMILGEILFRSGMASKAIDGIDQWMGKLPGRLALVTVIAATVFSTMSGSTPATTAMLGQALLPEMVKRGYNRSLSIGTIMGSGGLAMLIPPSSAAVLWASLAVVSVSKLLIAGIVPGLILAGFYAVYVVGRCWLQPSLAPAYNVENQKPFKEKFIFTAKYILPLSFIIFMVTGIMLLGMASASESAAMGVLGALIMVIIYRKFSWKMVSESAISTLKNSTMILLILATSKTYSQILAYTGSASQFTAWVSDFSMNPILIIVVMMVILTILGMFMSGVAMMMICIPIFLPIVKALGFDPIWFGLLFLVNIEMGHTTPPFGTLLFIMKAVAPKNTSMNEIIMSAVPFIGMHILLISLVIAFPSLVTWLPNIMN